MGKRKHDEYAEEDDNDNEEVKRRRKDYERQAEELLQKIDKCKSLKIYLYLIFWFRSLTIH